ncbi:hypothetical protein [Arthrobacter sp. NicSoilB8]|jgi:hypothetical protein|uniref:hypothetical protein n=1 Tax=Arthrobacter sp. NicSoilB8 TaxID=2830998 RepID=UPI001CC73B93|nr:hypothetical protein [Arthrobacter sp. NicSoilB8]BCW73002.1 hypothetical protein NicSoilB8_40460 [Arthrobacter sp. NicSoilB8]
MSITSASNNRRLHQAKVALIPAVALGLLGGPVALAAPAGASTSDHGCTVDPLKPTTRDSWDAKRDSSRVDFRIRVACSGGKTVQIRQLRIEDESGRRHNTILGFSTFWESFDHRGNSVTLHSPDNVPNLDRHHGEKVFQFVSFRVRSGHSDHWSDWTNWEKSDVATVHG